MTHPSHKMRYSGSSQYDEVCEFCGCTDGTPTSIKKLEQRCLALSFQDEVDRWMDECFGAKIKADKLERADRFIEEALELSQTIEGFNAARAHALVDYVFARPVGEAFQEVGGVSITLAALCCAIKVDLKSAADDELERVWNKIEKIRAKQAAKPTGSALPVAEKSTVELVNRLFEIDKQFESATGWGSWMVETANEREALVERLRKLGLKIEHKYQARNENGGRVS